MRVSRHEHADSSEALNACDAKRHCVRGPLRRTGFESTMVCTTSPNFRSGSKYRGTRVALLAQLTNNNSSQFFSA